MKIFVQFLQKSVWRWLEGKTDAMKGKTDDMKGKTDDMKGKTDDMKGKTDDMKSKTDDMKGKTDERWSLLVYNIVHMKVDVVYDYTCI